MSKCLKCGKGFNARSVFFCDGCGISSHKKCLNKLSNTSDKFYFCGKCLSSFSSIPKSVAKHDTSLVELKHLHNKLKLEFEVIEQKLDTLETELLAREKLPECDENLSQTFEISPPEITISFTEEHVDLFEAESENIVNVVSYERSFRKVFAA